MKKNSEEDSDDSDNLQEPHDLDGKWGNGSIFRTF